MGHFCYYLCFYIVTMPWSCTVVKLLATILLYAAISNMVEVLLPKQQLALAAALLYWLQLLTTAAKTSSSTKIYVFPTASVI